jgi:hypothetical protein
LIRVAITAFEAVKAMLPVGSVAVEPQIGEKASCVSRITD